MKGRRRPIWYRNKRLRVACILSLILVLGALGTAIFIKYGRVESGANKAMQEDTKGRVKDMLLEHNIYSRPGIELKHVKAVVIHYTANPGTTAEANRNYFNRLPELNARREKPVYASSHYIVGLEGEIIRCIPETEISYASNGRNGDTLSIECCHPKRNGKFTKETYDSLVWLTSLICWNYNLEEENIIRHYDITGKNCPKYFVENEHAWQQFKDDVMELKRKYIER